MNFNHIEYFPIVAVFLIVFISIVWISEKRFFKWVKDHWFYQRSKRNKLASILYFIGISLLAIALLDLRGPEKRLKTEIASQRTMIMIDTSLSMLAEDVRPSRINKTVQIAKHFVRKAVGHNIGIVLFSDTQTRIIPFTDDLDILDARLNAVKNPNNMKGGSNIRASLQEVIGYFKEVAGAGGKVSGNILLFTDAEENYSNMNLSFPADVTLAVVGVGTAKGSKIPLRGKDGRLMGHKRHNGTPVITKLSEAEIRNIGSNVSAFKYWILSSFAIPTEEILNFFNKTYAEKNRETDIIIKPVYTEFILVPALIILMMAFLLKGSMSFATLLLLIAFPTFAQQPPSQEEKPDIMTSPLLEKVRSGKANRQERLKAAEVLLRSEKYDQAVKLFEENISEKDLSDESMSKTVFNYGTALLQQGNVRKGAQVLDKVKDIIQDEEVKKKIRSNVLQAIRKEKSQQNQKSKGKQDEEQDKDKKNKKKQKGQSGDNDSKSNQQKKNDEQNADKNKQGNNNSPDGKNKKKENKEEAEKDKKEDEKSDQDKKDQDKDKKKDKDKEKSSKEGNKDNKDKASEDGKKDDAKGKGNNSQGKKFRKKVKLPVMLQQLVDKDKKLQEKFFKTSTQKNEGSRKDW